MAGAFFLIVLRLKATVSVQDSILGQSEQSRNPVANCWRTFVDCRFILANTFSTPHEHMSAFLLQFSTRRCTSSCLRMSGMTSSISRRSLSSTNDSSSNNPTEFQSLLRNLKASEHYDLVVIGSGPAAQKCAIDSAKRGKKVAVVDKKDMIGGVCVHTGTIPSKVRIVPLAFLFGVPTHPSIDFSGSSVASNSTSSQGLLWHFVYWKFS